MPDTEKYASLKEFVRRRGGLRLGVHPKLRDQLIDIGVEEFPLDADDEHGPAVLAARIKRKAEEKYGFAVVTMILVSILANLVSRAIWEWWKKRHAHQVLMAGWQSQAKAGH